MSDTSTAANSGLSLGSVLLVVFIVLKVTHNIAWSWWWVLAPLWIGWGLVVLVVAIGLLVAAIAAVADR